MDACVVCFSENIDALSRIDLQSSEWPECNIQRIIEKHLWFWHLKKTSSNFQWICRQCWKELFSFHSFYKMIENVHKQYDLVKWPVLKNETIDSSNDNEVNELPVLVICKQELEDDSFITETSDCRDSDLVDDIWKPSKHYETKREKCKKLANSLNSDLVDDIWKPSKHYETQKEESKKLSSSKNCCKKLTAEERKQITKRKDEYLAQSGYKLFCDICNMTLKDFLHLTTHYRQEHKILGYAKCCNKRFYNRGLLADHLKVHEDPNYFKCSICERVLGDRASFENHLETHKPSNEISKPFLKCNECDKLFFKKSVYNRHILSHVPEEERKFKCDECDRKFPDENMLKKHKAGVHQKKYVKICEICGKSFQQQMYFKRHMDIHNGLPIVNVSCDICKKELTNKAQLTRHKNVMHADTQELICPYCSMVFRKRRGYLGHIRYKHTNNSLKHACNICEKKFISPYRLKEHLGTHTREPLYTCPHCPKTFIFNANFNKHRKTAHPKEWQESQLKKSAATEIRDVLSVTEHLHTSASTNITENI